MFKFTDKLYNDILEQIELKYTKLFEKAIDYNNPKDIALSFYCFGIVDDGIEFKKHVLKEFNLHYGDK